MKLPTAFVIIITFCLNNVSYCQSSQKTEKDIFQELDGMVIFEAESIPLTKGWSLEKTVENYSGDGYITWIDSTTIEPNGQGLLSYKFLITKPGVYTLKMRNYHSCEDFTECNDVFVRMDDGNWRKNFNHTLSHWDWNSQQDIHHVFSNSQFLLKEGVHQLQISGRSKDFSIDKIALYHKDTPDNAYKSAELSKIITENN